MAEVLPRNVLLRVGGKALDRGVLAMPGAGRGFVEVVETSTRASVGYFLDRDGIIRKAAADKVRDYWPVGVVDAKGRRLHGPLIESARTNGWATVTENYADAAWSKNGATITANAFTAPDAVGLADKLVESALNEAHNVGRGIAGMTDNLRTSVWWLVHGAERTWARIQTVNKANVSRHTWFNLATGVLGTKDAGHDAWIRALGNSWWFVAASFDASAGGTTPQGFIALATADNITNYAGDGASGLYVWESGVEVDKPFPSYPGSILPNGLARAADGPIGATVPANFGPFNTTVLARMDRPLHVDVGAAVDLGSFPGIFAIGDEGQVNGGSIRAEFRQSNRDLETDIVTPTTDVFQASTALPAGPELALCAQYRDLTTGGRAKSDVGTGFGAESGPAAGFSAYDAQRLRIGAINAAGRELNGVLFDLMPLHGLFTRAEAMAASDA